MKLWGPQENWEQATILYSYMVTGISCHVHNRASIATSLLMHNNVMSLQRYALVRYNGISQSHHPWWSISSQYNLIGLLFPCGYHNGTSQSCHPWQSMCCHFCSYVVSTYNARSQSCHPPWCICCHFCSYVDITYNGTSSHTIYDGVCAATWTTPEWVHHPQWQMGGSGSTFCT